MSRSGQIAVIGSGIVGASIAYHLARRGEAVVLVDGGQPGDGVTARSFGWLNVSHGRTQRYRQLRLRALADWHRLETDLRRVLANWCGALSWSADQAETERMVCTYAAEGFDLELVERGAIRRREPGLLDPPACAALAPEEGAVDPAAVTRTMVAAAVENGAEVVAGRTAQEILTDNGRVVGLVLSDSGPDGGSPAAGRLPADRVVVAAGTGATDLLAGMAVPMTLVPSPSVLLRFTGAAPLVNGIVAGPDFECRHSADGRLWAAEDYDVGADPPALAEIIGQDALVALRAGLAGAEDLALLSAEIGWRPMPADDLPIIGPVPSVEGLHVAVMHVGVTLAPLVGRLVAVALTGEGDPAELSGFEPR